MTEDSKPAEWKLVPVAPTVAMPKAAGECFSRMLVTHNGGASGADYWRTMLAAAPVRSGEEKPAAWRTDIFEQLSNGRLTRLVLDADEVTDPSPDWKPLYATPRPSELVAALREAEADKVALHQTIGRVWKALGIETYEQAGGKDISEIVAERCHAALATPGLAASRPTVGVTKPAGIPDDIAERVRAVGKVEWGATEAKTDAELIEWFSANLAKTREHFEITAEMTEIHGVFLDGTGVLLCETGNSPNSPTHARAIVGAWNRLVDDCEALPALTPIEGV